MLNGVTSGTLNTVLLKQLACGTIHSQCNDLKELNSLYLKT